MRRNFGEMLVLFIIFVVYYSVVDPNYINILNFYKEKPAIVKNDMPVQGEEILPRIRPEGRDFLDSVRSSEMTQKCL